MSTSKLRDVAQSRMWKWLFDAHRLLGVTVEVVDDRLNVLSLPVGGGLVGREPDPTDGSLQDAVVESLTTATPTTTTTSGYQISCTPIVVAGSKFQAGASVSIAGLPATGVVFESASAIDAVTP